MKQVKAEELLLLQHLERTLGRSSGHVPEVQFHCPECVNRRGSESSKKTLYVNISTGKGICFRCEYKFNKIATLLRLLSGGQLSSDDLELIESSGPREYVERLRDTVLVMLFASDDTPDLAHLKAQRLPPCKAVWENHGVAHRRGAQYMKRRGIDPEAGKRFDVRYCAEGDYAYRLIFPVRQGGRIVYWTNRSVMKDDPLKSKNPTNKEGYYTKNDCLLNFDNVVGAKVVNIVEGPFDMFGCRFPVALMGKTISDVQVDLLRALAQQGTEEFVLTLDAEVDPLPYYERLSGVVQKVSYVPIDQGDPFDRRDEMEDLMETRRSPTASDAIPRRRKDKFKRKEHDRYGTVRENVLRRLKRPRDAEKTA